MYKYIIQQNIKKINFIETTFFYILIEANALNMILLIFNEKFLMKNL